MYTKTLRDSMQALQKSRRYFLRLCESARRLNGFTHKDSTYVRTDVRPTVCRNLCTNHANHMPCQQRADTRRLLQGRILRTPVQESCGKMVTGSRRIDRLTSRSRNGPRSPRLRRPMPLPYRPSQPLHRPSGQAPAMPHAPAAR